MEFRKFLLLPCLVVKRSQNQRWEISSAQKNHESLAKTSLSSPAQRRARNGWMRAWRKSYFFLISAIDSRRIGRKTFQLWIIFSVFFPLLIYFLSSTSSSHSHTMRNWLEAPAQCVQNSFVAGNSKFLDEKGKRSAKNKTFPLSLFLPNENFCWLSRRVWSARAELSFSTDFSMPQRSVLQQQQQPVAYKWRKGFSLLFWIINKPWVAFFLHLHAVLLLRLSCFSCVIPSFTLIYFSILTRLCCAANPMWCMCVCDVPTNHPLAWMFFLRIWNLLNLLSFPTGPAKEQHGEQHDWNHWSRTLCRLRSWFSDWALMPTHSRREKTLWTVSKRKRWVLCEFWLWKTFLTARVCCRVFLFFWNI